MADEVTPEHEDPEADEEFGGDLDEEALDELDMDELYESDLEDDEDF
jgi:hypothetical protein